MHLNTYERGEDMSNYREQFSKWALSLAPYEFASTLISWDAATEAPPMSSAYRAKMIGALMSTYSSRFYDPNQIPMLEGFLQLSDITPIEEASCKEALRRIRKMQNVPMELIVEGHQHTSLAQRVWEEARAKQDFSIFAPALEKSIDLAKRTLEYRSHPSGQAYDVLLDDYELGMTMEKYDAFFGALRTNLVPFVRSVHSSAEPIDDSLLSAFFAKEGQEEYLEYLIDVMRYDRARGLMKTSAHPFTTLTSTDDVRFTVRYLENYMPASVFAGLHEMGHALHFLQVNPVFVDYIMPFSMVLGESQSRFYENFVGRSLPFWQKHFAKLAEIFPEQLAQETPESFWRIVNRSKPTMIRVEADELTYPMHIMLRYEIERAIFEDNLPVADLPEMWNAKMKEYLGVVPANDSEGILQDSHWSGGAFGYFPTYALGTAYAAQFHSTMKQQLDLDQVVLDDRMEVINAWLAEHVHREGMLLPTDVLVEQVTGAPFSPDFLVNYLKEKYAQVYRLG